MGVLFDFYIFKLSHFFLLSNVCKEIYSNFLCRIQARQREAFVEFLGCVLHPCSHIVHIALHSAYCILHSYTLSTPSHLRIVMLSLLQSLYNMKTSCVALLLSYGMKNQFCKFSEKNLFSRSLLTTIPLSTFLLYLHFFFHIFPFITFLSSPSLSWYFLFHLKMHFYSVVFPMQYRI